VCKINHSDHTLSIKVTKHINRMLLLLALLLQLFQFLGLLKLLQQFCCLITLWASLLLGTGHSRSTRQIPGDVLTDCTNKHCWLLQVP
jgi:hypothetical protein